LGGAAGVKAAMASMIGKVGKKPINLPSSKKVAVDMAHVAERHIAGGSGATNSKTVFPSTMSVKGVERAIREAYASSKKIGVQLPDRVKLLGQGAGMKIEMWFNKAKNVIETAYPSRQQ
jgi:hypothetical protein